jgi:cytoskeletal protein RodZ
MLGSNFQPDVNAMQMGMQIGDTVGKANSPFTGVNMALKDVLGKYNAHLTAQTEQQGKMDLQTHEYDLKKSMYGANGAADPDASGPTVQFDPTTKKYFYKNTTMDTNGIPKVSWSPVSPMGPTNEEQIFKNNIYGNLNKEVTVADAGSPLPGVPAAPTMPVAPTTNATKALDKATAMQFVQKAGGDKNKARAMAQQAGYTF